MTEEKFSIRQDLDYDITYLSLLKQVMCTEQKLTW